MRISLDERRRVIGRTVMSLTNKSGPLSTPDLSSLRRLTQEMEEIESDIAVAADRKHAAAFRSWLRQGMVATQHSDGITAEQRAILEKRDLTSGGSGAGIATTGGGVFISLEFNSLVESALKFYGPLLDPDLVTIQDTVTGAPRAYAADNDTTVSGSQLSESAQTIQADISGLLGVTLKSFRYSSNIVKASMELVQDQNVDLEAYLADRFAVRIARALHPKLSTGVGTTEPFGVVTQAVLGATAVGSSSNDGTAASTNTLGTNDFATLEGSLDPLYRARAKWMLHPDTLTALRDVKNKQGQPVFPDLHGGGVNRIMNYEVALNPDMDKLSANPNSPPVAKKVVLFGDFKRYVIRRVPAIVNRLSERWADFGIVGYLYQQRYDANLIDGGGAAIKYLSSVY